MKEYKERNNFVLRTTFRKCPVPNAKIYLKSAPQKLDFVMEKVISKVIHQVVAPNVFAHSYIATHKNTASFSIKTTLCETNDILFSKNY